MWSPTSTYVSIIYKTFAWLNVNGKWLPSWLFTYQMGCIAGIVYMSVPLTSFCTFATGCGSLLVKVECQTNLGGLTISWVNFMKLQYIVKLMWSVQSHFLKKKNSVSGILWDILSNLNNWFIMLALTIIFEWNPSKYWHKWLFSTISTVSLMLLGSYIKMFSCKASAQNVACIVTH